MKIEGEDLKEYHWPYSCIDKADFLAQIISVEKILQKYGAEHIEDICEKGKWLLSDDSYAVKPSKNTFGKGKMSIYVWTESTFPKSLSLSWSLRKTKKVLMKMLTHFHMICLIPS